MNRYYWVVIVAILTFSLILLGSRVFAQEEVLIDPNPVCYFEAPDGSATDLSELCGVSENSSLEEQLSERHREALARLDNAILEIEKEEVRQFEAFRGTPVHENWKELVLQTAPVVEIEILIP